MKIVRRGAVDGEDDGEKKSVAVVRTTYKEKKQKGKGDGPIHEEEERMSCFYSLDAPYYN